jgi:hypothetical protein
MEQATKTALGIAAIGYGLNRYENYKLRTSEKGYLEQADQNLKMAGSGIAILGLASAGIFQSTKNNPKARKLAFLGLGGLTVGYFVVIAYAMKKMT